MPHRPSRTARHASPITPRPLLLPITPRPLRLASGAAPDVASARGLTALMRAAARGSVAGVRALFEAGASVDARAEGKGLHGATALYLAAQGGHVDAVRALLGAGSSVRGGSKVGGRNPAQRRGIAARGRAHVTWRPL